MSPLAEFEDCRSRIRRAEAHNEAFAKTWNEFIDHDPYHAFLRMNDDGTGELHAERYDDFPESLSLDLGEMLYQLRAALDGCIYAAAILQSGQNPPPNEERLEFPLCSSPEEFKRALWHVRPLKNSPRLMEIIETVQPYRVPDIRPDQMVLNLNRTLGILHDLARKDRHRSLHVVGSWRSNMKPHLMLPDGCELDYMLVTGDGPIEADTLVARFKLSGFTPGMEVQGNPDLAIDVAIDQAPPPCADNDTASRRAQSMIVSTETVVAAFERAFLEPMPEDGIRRLK